MALSIVSILIWFCLRRRKQKKQRDSIASYRSPTKDYVLDRSFSPADHPPTGGDVFAEFGGTSYSSPERDISLTFSQDDTNPHIQHQQHQQLAKEQRQKTP
jgi:hypothetical protein